MDGARRYAEARAGQDPQYTAHPATWLNAGRWDDEIQATTPGANGYGRHTEGRSLVETTKQVLDRLETDRLDALQNERGDRYATSGSSGEPIVWLLPKN